MTEKKFFNIVKGRRIRWSDWCTGACFIPETLISGKDICGKYTYNNFQVVDCFRIENGFEPNGQSHRWELVDTEYIVME